MKTNLHINTGIVAALYAIAFVSVLAIFFMPSITWAAITNPGTAGSGTGALPDSGCPSCNTTGPIGTDTGIGVPSPISSTLPSGSTYRQSGYSTYRQSGYTASYRQSGYTTYGQSGYASSYRQSGYSTYTPSESLVSSGGEYGQGAYFTCPSGQTVVNGNSCCPSANVVWESTGKGQRAVACTNSIVVDSCPVNGTTIPNGGTYTFYTVGNVPYGETCDAYAVSRTCNAGQFSGSDTGLYSMCVVDDAPQISTITIDAIPPIVRYGEDAEIIWDGGNAEACTVTGYGLTNVTGITGTAPVENVTGESVYTLNCTLGPNSRSASTTLKVLPRTQET